MRHVEISPYSVRMSLISKSTYLQSLKKIYNGTFELFEDLARISGFAGYFLVFEMIS